jgi:tetratricopeptide (TPR) repeat protein
LFILSFSICSFVFPQSKKADSLRAITVAHPNDTIGLNAFISMARGMGRESPDSVPQVVARGLALCERQLKAENDPSVKRTYRSKMGSLKYQYGSMFQLHGDFIKAEPFFREAIRIALEEADSSGYIAGISMLGNNFISQGYNDSALYYYNIAFRIAIRTNNKERIGNLTNNIALVYADQGLVKLALDFYEKSLKERLAIGNKGQIAATLSNIAIIYHEQGQGAEAKKYFEQALAYSREEGDKKHIAITLGNVAIVLKDEGKMEEALKYCFESLKIREELKDKHGISQSHFNLGDIYNEMQRYEDAEHELLLAIKISKEIGDISTEGQIYLTLAKTYYFQNKMNDALIPAQKSLDIAQQTKVLMNIKNSAQMLTDIYDKLGNAPKTLENYRLFIKFRDSVTNDETKRVAMQEKFELEYAAKEREVKLVAEADKKILIEKQDAQKKRSNIIIGAIVLVLLMVSIFALFVLRSLAEKKKANAIISEQKKMVEDKQKEVMESIHYAKRIQMAQIPTEKQVVKLFKRLRTTKE